MKKYLSLVAALLFVNIIAFAQQTVKKTFTGVKRINIKTSSGDCELRKATGSSVEVELTYTYDDEDFTPKFEQTGERLELGERQGHGNRSGSARWKLSIPDGMKVDLSTGSGDLVVNGVDVELDANTGSGDIEFATVKGIVDANTGSGNVDVTAFNGEAKINTGSGDMDIRDIEGELRLNCGSGDINVSRSKAYFDVNTGSGDISADKLTIAGISKFNTGSGRARVTLAATPTADLSVNSGSGNAELNFGGNEIVGEIVMKTSKKWGSISAPFDFDKTEEVSYGNGKDNITIVKTAQRGKATNRITVSTGSGDAVLRK